MGTQLKRVRRVVGQPRYDLAARIPVARRRPTCPPTIGRAIRATILIADSGCTAGIRCRGPIQRHLTIPTQRGKFGCARTTRRRGRDHVGDSHRSPLAIDHTHGQLIRHAVGQPGYLLAAGRIAARHSGPSRPILTRIRNTPPSLILADGSANGRSRPTQHHLTIPIRRRKRQVRLRRGRLRRRRTGSHVVDRPHRKLVPHPKGQPRDRAIPRCAVPRHRRPIRPAMTRIGHPPLHLIPRNRRAVGSRSRPI